MVTGQGDGGLSQRPRVRRGERCLNCYRSKAGCSALPCGRCFKLCLQCQPQSPLDAGRPFVDIAMSMLETDAFNTECMEVCRRTHAQGCLDRTALRHLMCSWRCMKKRWGADRTHGLCDAVCSAFDITTDEPPTPSRGAPNPRQETEAAAALRQQFMVTPTFTLLDDGVSVLVVETVRGDGVTFAMNSASEALLCSDQEADDLLQRYQLLPIHMLACMLDPEDRVHLLQAYMDMCSTARRNGCSFVKFCERDGTTDLHILRWRYMQLPDFPESLTVAFTFQRAPQTRYLTRRPGHLHFVVERFVRRRLPYGKDSKDAAAADAGVVPRPPAITCLPLPPDASLRDVYDCKATDMPQADAACDPVRLARWRELIEQYSRSSPATSALSTQEYTAPPPPPQPPPVLPPTPQSSRASLRLASPSLPPPQSTPSFPQHSHPPLSPPRSPSEAPTPSPLSSSSSVSMLYPYLAQDGGGGAANEQMSQLRWSLWPPSPPFRPSSARIQPPSSSPPSSSPSSKPSQPTQRLVPPPPPGSPPGLLLPQPFLPQLHPPLPHQHTESPYTCGTSASRHPATQMQHGAAPSLHDLQGTQPQFTSSTGEPMRQEHGQGDDDILQAMRELMQE